MGEVSQREDLGLASVLIDDVGYEVRMKVDAPLNPGMCVWEVRRSN